MVTDRQTDTLTNQVLCTCVLRVNKCNSFLSSEASFRPLYLNSDISLGGLVSLANYAHLLITVASTTWNIVGGRVESLQIIDQITLLAECNKTLYRVQLSCSWSA